MSRLQKTGVARDVLIASLVGFDGGALGETRPTLRFMGEGRGPGRNAADSCARPAARAVPGDFQVCGCIDIEQLLGPAAREAEGLSAQGARQTL